MKFIRKSKNILIPAIFLILLITLILSRVIKPDMETQPIGTIEFNEAVNHIGKVMNVCGQVSEAVYLQEIGGNPVFINFGGRNPNHTFSIVIWSRYHRNFSERPDLLYSNSYMCVTGTIEEHRGKPQIIVERQTQIEVSS